MIITVSLVFEKEAPKSFAYGARTKSNVLIKVWVPKELLGKEPPDELEAEVTLPDAKKKKSGKVKSKANQEFEDEDEDEEEDDDFENDNDEAEDEDEDEKIPVKKRSRSRR